MAEYSGGITAPVEMVPVNVAYRRHDGTMARASVHGWLTANRHLVITAGWDHCGEPSGSFVLTHSLTGLALTTNFPGTLLKIAARLAHLDWGSVTAETFPGSEMAKEAKKVIRELQFTDPGAVELPAHDAWGPVGKGNGIKRAAVPMALDMLADIQKALSKTSGEDVVPFDEPNPDKPGDRRMSYEWAFWSHRIVQDYGLAYLLLTLHRLDPEIADSAAAFLADSWEGGDSLGEWAWEWHQALLKGETPELSGVPQLGELFESASEGGRS